MEKYRRFAIVACVIAVAATVGFLMQNGNAAKARYAKSNVPDISGTASDPMTVTGIELTSAPANTRGQNVVISENALNAGSNAATDKDVIIPVRTAALGGAVIAEPSAPITKKEVISEPVAEDTASCDVTMTAIPGVAAMVDVELNAPCLPNERVTFHHNGMMFTQSTDENGQVALTVPALAKNAVFIAAFANGDGALANAQVTSLDYYDRMVVQSKASGNLHINAYEFGAEYRGKGHITAASERTIDDATNGVGGIVTSLGDPDIAEALVAEVYTFPSAASLKAGDVVVSVDAEVTIDNCGLQVEAQTLEVRRGGKMKVQDLTLAVPACDALGDFLVLQNLLEDLKVARN